MWVQHLESASSSLKLSCPCSYCMEQKQAGQAEPCPNCQSVSKINYCCCFKPLSLGVVYFAAIDNWRIASVDSHSWWLFFLCAWWSLNVNLLLDLSYQESYKLKLGKPSSRGLPPSPSSRGAQLTWVYLRSSQGLGWTWEYQVQMPHLSDSPRLSISIPMLSSALSGQLYLSQLSPALSPSRSWFFWGGDSWGLFYFLQDHSDSRRGQFIRTSAGRKL